MQGFWTHMLCVLLSGKEEYQDLYLHKCLLTLSLPTSHFPFSQVLKDWNSSCLESSLGSIYSIKFKQKHLSKLEVCGCEYMTGTHTSPQPAVTAHSCSKTKQQTSHTLPGVSQTPHRHKDPVLKVKLHGADTRLSFPLSMRPTEYARYEQDHSGGFTVTNTRIFCNERWLRKTCRFFQKWSLQPFRLILTQVFYQVILYRIRIDEVFPLQSRLQQVLVTFLTDHKTLALKTPRSYHHCLILTSILMIMTKKLPFLCSTGMSSIKSVLLGYRLTHKFTSWSSSGYLNILSDIKRQKTTKCYFCLRTAFSWPFKNPFSFMFHTLHSTLCQ